MAGRWSQAKAASASGTKNRLNAGTYVLLIASLSDKPSRKGVPMDVCEFSIDTVISEQRYMYQGKKDPEATEQKSSKPGERASEMFWFDPNNDMTDLAYGNFKGLCCACLKLTEAEANEIPDDEWDELVEGLHGRGKDPEPAAGKKVIAIVTKETVVAGTHNYLKTTFAPYEDEEEDEAAA